MQRKKLAAIALLTMALMVGGAVAQLRVQVSNVGQVVGQTKELTISVQGGVALLGTVSILPGCATAAASTFADVATATINWGSNLQSDTDYETFFCLGNIGTSAGVVHVSTSGQAAGESEIFEVAQTSLLGGLSFGPCDGASIGGLGVIAVRGHLHTPSAGLNGIVSLTGKTTFTFG